jgi:hypothetical protein
MFIFTQNNSDFRNETIIDSYRLFNAMGHEFIHIGQYVNNQPFVLREYGAYNWNYMVTKDLVYKKNTDIRFPNLKLEELKAKGERLYIKIFV